MKIEAQIEQAARILNKARHVTALTGAGHSTPSGIPDFRSPDSGVWQSVDPFQVASIFAFRQQPQSFYEWVRPMMHTMLNAEPNPAHYALAQLEEMGILKAVITQNIDGLHQRANSQVVYEVHGHLRQATCIRCYTKVPAAPLIHDLVENGGVPRCEKCDGVLKPDVILFGEQLPIQELVAAQQAARRSDVMIVAGSSLQVAPAGDIPLLTKERGGKLIFINFGPTHLDDLADIVMRADVADALPQLVRAVRREQATGFKE
ncbi:MAG: NAD-dependent protein deacylase [Anaerolineae bacterium]|jgi:NAD-dependent deacetylase